MDARFPVNLFDYCSYFEIPFFNLKLKCIFCNFYLSLTDLADFYQKDLCLVWRNKCCFACCAKCLRLSAAYEYNTYFVCCVTGTTLEFLQKKSLNEIIIRCSSCLRKLDYAEKIQHSFNERFCLVRGHWRGCCRFCSKKE